MHIKAAWPGFTESGGMSATAELPLPSRLPSARPSGAPARPRTTVFLPREHGSWSLALEPVALGLLIAPSWAGGALAGAALAGFFSRRPLKTAGDASNPSRRLEAREALVMWGSLALAGGVETLVLASWTSLWPLLPAALLGVVFSWFDAQGDSRAAAAEVAGSAAFAFVPAALASLAGWPVSTALALVFLALARSVPAVLAVRGCLRLAKGGAVRRTPSVIVAALALGGTVALVAAGFAPASAGALGALLFVRVLWLLGPWRPAWPAKRIGMMEAVLGLLYVAVLAATWPVADAANP